MLRRIASLALVLGLSMPFQTIALGKRREPPSLSPLPVPVTASKFETCTHKEKGASRYSPAYLVSLQMEQLEHPSKVPPLHCRYERDVISSHHYRIDLTTCGADPEVIRSIENVIARSYDVLHCLSGYNKRLVAYLLRYIRNHRPRIRCLGHLPGAALARACQESPSPQSCVHQASIPGTEAFQLGSSPDLNLVSADPLLEATEGFLPELVIHELMHAAGIPDDPRLHNPLTRKRYWRSMPSSLRTDELYSRLERWSKADPVYAATILCGGSPPGSLIQLPVISKLDSLKLESWNREGEALPLLEKGKTGERLQQHILPGTLFEVACTSLTDFRPPYGGKPSSDFNLFNLRSISPSCRERSVMINRALRDFKRREIERQERDMKDLRSIYDELDGD